MKVMKTHLSAGWLEWGLEVDDIEASIELKRLLKPLSAAEPYMRLVEPGAARCADIELTTGSDERQCVHISVLSRSTDGGWSVDYGSKLDFESLRLIAHGPSLSAVQPVAAEAQPGRLGHIASDLARMERL